jgi:hypothetical protein
MPQRFCLDEDFLLAKAGLVPLVEVRNTEAAGGTASVPSG